MMSAFRPLAREGGYLPLEDHGLIGDGASAALVGRDGAISWMCLPRFHSRPIFAALLDAGGGGAWRISVEGLVEARQRYVEDTAVLVTELRGPEGVLRLTDAMVLHENADLAEDALSDRGELVRLLEVVEGRVRVRFELVPRGRHHARARGLGMQIVMHERFELDLQLGASLPLDRLATTFDLGQGERAQFRLRWKGGHYYHHPKEPEAQIEATERAWRGWVRAISYEGPRKALVRRSAITLKLLDNFENGAIIAAPTSSLPEWIGADLNWDYRYVWVRDAAFSVYALDRIGLTAEGGAFLGWVLDQVERHQKPRLLYTVLGDAPEPEWEDPTLEGYRRSPPVRFGNGAADQRQDDVYGEIIDCAWQWVRHREEIRPALWEKLCGFAEEAARDWDSCDHGIWELRNEGRPYTYSAALCHVAVDRMARLGEHLGTPGQCGEWRAAAEKIRAGIIERAWDEELRSFTMWLGGGGLDASILCLPLRRVVEATHPRMQASIETIAKCLSGGGGLIHRFLDSESPEPLPTEGAFLLCSFWLVENLVLLGRKDEAMELFHSLCDRASPLGLLSEEIDPSSGAFLGNFPQAFSQIGVIAAGVRLARAFGGTDLPGRA